MKLPRFFLIAFLVGLIGSSTRATVVIPPTFDQLVRDAELIFESTVTGTRSEWLGEGANRVIVTYVTFEIADAIKGVPGQNYTIRMLGGTIDGETAEVADAPRFKVGDHDILFVEHNGVQFVPLVGIMYGRFRVHEDIIAKDNGSPVSDVAKLGTDEMGAVSGSPLSKTAFKAAIRQKLSELRLTK